MLPGVPLQNWCLDLSGNRSMANFRPPAAPDLASMTTWSKKARGAVGAALPNRRSLRVPILSYQIKADGCRKYSVWVN